MAVTDLTNTTWVFNDVFTDTSNIAYLSIEFTSNDTTYTFLSGQTVGGYRVIYGSTRVYSGGIWIDDAYKTVTFTGGSDATSSSLIAWMEANATQQASAVTYYATSDEFTAVANAIRTKGGTSAPLEWTAGYISAINALPTGGGGSTANPDDVIFIDYDGTIVYSYSKADFLALNEFPANPTHVGLTSQGWNWTLANAKTHVTQCERLIIGQQYITDDDKTRLYISILTNGRMAVPLYWSQTVANGVTVDWGDGSGTQTFAEAGNCNITHTYSSVGDYVITLSVTSGTLTLGRSSTTVLGSIAADNVVYRNMLKRVEIGNNVTTIGTDAFYSCYSLESITIPSRVTDIGARAFGTCYSLYSIVIPNGVSNIGNNTFQNCYTLSKLALPNGVTTIGANSIQSCFSLASITIPGSVTSIGNYAFQNNLSLAAIVIPDSVTNIGNYAFHSCRGVAEYHLLRTTPPTLGSNAFTNISAACVIYVPYSADHSVLTTYKASTNWSTYASYMQEEPQ